MKRIKRRLVPMSTLRNSWQGNGAVLIGLTATPGRGWGLSDEDERLADLFQANRVEIDSRGHPNPVAYLVANGYLASPRFRAVDFDSGGFEVSKSVDYGDRGSGEAGG